MNNTFSEEILQKVYSHRPTHGIQTTFPSIRHQIVDTDPVSQDSTPLQIALLTIQIAMRLGVKLHDR